MTKFYLLLIIGFLLPNFMTAQTARVQVIHNSADVAATQVDVYVNGVLALDDFTFRTATPFLDLPAIIPVEVAVAPSNSTSVADSIKRFNYTLTANTTYILVADGIVSATGYTPGNTGASAFDLKVYNMGQESAALAANTDVLVHHGATDAPAVDVVEVSVPAGAIVQNASYGDFAGYLPLATANYRLEVRPAGAATAVASYEAPLATLGLQDSAMVVLASGFLDPSQNSNGPAFGLWAALPAGGPLVELPTSTARAQVIHNSPDALANQVDVYLDGALLLDDFTFRNATPFVDLPAGRAIEVAVAPSTSTSVADSIKRFSYTLAANETYILVADGIVSGSGYNPGAMMAGFDIAVYNMGQEAAVLAANTDVLVHHGATDAPAVDVVEVSVPAGAIVQNASYGDFAGYLPLATADYTLEVRPAGSATAVASYAAPLATLGLQGQALLAVASGFLDPSQNSNGPAFGLWVAPAAGGPMVRLPNSTARAQVIHNSADAAANQVDVYLDGTLLLDDFTFRTATPFVDLPAGRAIEVAVAPSTSTSVADSIKRFSYTLAANETYILVADGIVSTSGYSPSTANEAFDLKVYNMGQESAALAANTDVLVHHGATDAPAVDVVEVSVPAGAIVQNASYGDFAGYLPLATADYRLEVRPAGAATAVASYEAPLATLGLQDSAIVVLASGFLDPSQNSNGPAFGLWVALPEGGALVQLPVTPTTARAQIIHNSADLAAGVVDVYLDGTLLLDDFTFRTATPFIDVPASRGIEIAIAPGSSNSVADSIKRFNYTLTGNATYVIVADGIVSTTGYNPSTANEALDLKVYNLGQESAALVNNTDVLIHHGATDAPAIDVVEVRVPAGAIVQNASYGDFSGYLQLGTTDYRLEVRPAGAATAVASYEAPLLALGLQDSAIVAVASGFLDPSQNSNASEFGIWVATPAGGPMLRLEESETRLQVIHNSPDTTARMVDVYLDGALLIDSFEFRTSSAFIDAPAGVNVEVAIAPSNSTSVADSLKRFNYILDVDKTYIIVADGTIGAGYSPAQPFDLKVYDMARESALTPSDVDVLVHHGATDAPTVDVRGSDTTTVLVDDASYGDFSNYITLMNQDYVIRVTDASGANVVESYEAPLNTLGLVGNAITVVASGFLNTANNNDGEGFGLWVATANGGAMLPLPVVMTNIQLIQNQINGLNATIIGNPITANQLQLGLNSELENTDVTLDIIDMQGRTVQVLGNLNVIRGNNINTFDLETAPAGMYFLRISTANQMMVKQFIRNN